MSHVISQVAWGRFQRSFMPDFTTSLWDDLVLPLFLGLGIIIVSWGPLIVLVCALIFGALSGGGAEAASPADGEHVAKSTGPDLSVLTDPEADAAKLAEENRKLQELRPGGQMVREAEEAQAEASDPIGVFEYLLPSLRAGATMGFLLLVFAGWGLFYQPMAFAVAGYTQSVGSVLNPLVGLDTIRRMRGTYFKAFAMVIAVQIMMVIVGAIIGFVTSPFAFPIIGNPLANFVYATFTFYFDLVIACILGLALFKCAHRLGISVD